MCSYCGCRETPEIGLLMDQHEQIVNDVGALLRAHRSGAGTAQAFVVLSEHLAAHLAREETGLFAELRTDPEFATHIARLCDEHDDIEVLLSRVRDGEGDAVAALVDLLYRHIDKEDNGLFPAVAVAVDGSTWDAVAAHVSA